MEHLLGTVPHNKLMQGVLLSETIENVGVLEEFLTDQQKGESTTLIAAMAYALGTREGVHRERARRKRKAEAQALPTAKATVLRGGDAA